MEYSAALAPNNLRGFRRAILSQEPLHRAFCLTTFFRMSFWGGGGGRGGGAFMEPFHRLFCLATFFMISSWGAFIDNFVIAPPHEATEAPPPKREGSSRQTGVLEV